RFSQRRLARAGGPARQCGPGEVPGKARRRAAPPGLARARHRRCAPQAGGARSSPDRQGGPPRRARTPGRLSPPQGLRRYPARAGRGPRGGFAEMTDILPLGRVPENLGELPRKMLAWCIRPDREGDPDQAMKLEEVDVPQPGPNDALVLVMGAGVNFNGVWAARGKPVSVFKMHGEPMHIAGSDASGIVWKVGDQVKRWKVGDEVVIHCNQSCGQCPECNGLDPMACSEQD